MEREKQLKFHFKNGDWVVVDANLRQYREFTDKKELTEKNFIYFKNVAIDPMEVVFVEEFEKIYI